MLAALVMLCMISYNLRVFKQELDAVPGVPFIDYRNRALVNTVVDLHCTRMPCVQQVRGNNLCAIHAAAQHLSVVKVLLHEESIKVPLEKSWPYHLVLCPVPNYYPNEYGCSDDVATERLAQLTALAGGDDPDTD